jgi:hypothetical protein
MFENGLEDRGAIEVFHCRLNHQKRGRKNDQFQ